MVTIEERVSTLETEFRTELRHLATKADLAELETRMQANMQDLQTRIILSVGTMMIAAIAAVAAIMALPGLNPRTRRACPEPAEEPALSPPKSLP